MSHNRPINTVIDWPYDPQSGIPIPLDILSHDALDIPILDDGSTDAAGGADPVPENVRDALREEGSALDLVINEGTLSQASSVRLSADFTAPYRLIAAAVEFNRATNPANPTMWHRVNALAGLWGKDTRGQPATAVLGTSVTALVQEPPDYGPTAAVSFLAGEFQIAIGIQVGDLREGVTTPRPVDAICLAYSTAETQDGVSIWGSNDALGRTWTPIALSSLSSFGWKAGTQFVEMTNGSTDAPSRAFYFAKTERFMFYKAVFNTAIAQNMDVSAILALNLNGEVGVSFDGQAYDYQAGERVNPVTTEGRSFYEEHIHEGMTFDDVPTGWPAGSTPIGYSQTVKHPEANEIYALVMSRTPGDVIQHWVAKFSLTPTTGAIAYAARTEFTVGSSPHGNGITIVKLAGDSLYHVYASTDAYVRKYSTALAEEASYNGTATYSVMSGVASDGTSVWAIGIKNGNQATGHIDVVKLSDALTGPSITVIVSSVVGGILSNGWVPIFYRNSALYIAQAWETPFWRKYDSSSMTLLESRSTGLFDNYGNEISPLQNQFYGIASDGTYIYTLGSATYIGPIIYFLSRMTETFEQVDYVEIPYGQPDSIEGMSLEPDGQFFEIGAGSSVTSPTTGVIRRRRVFFNHATVSTVISWPLTLGAVMLVKLFFRPWSFSGIEEGIRIRRIFAFNDPRGIRVRRRNTLPANGLIRMQLQGAEARSVGEADAIQVDYLQSIAQYGQPREVNVFSRTEPLDESFAIPAGGNSTQILDRYHRPALYILNAEGDGLGRLGDSSFTPAIASTVMTDETPFGSTMTTTGQYQVNYRLGIVTAFDTLDAETCTFKVPDYGSFTIEFSPASNARGWASFEGIATATFGGSTSSQIGLRTNLSLLATNQKTNKRIWFRIETSRLVSSPKIFAQQAQSVSKQSDVGLGVRSDTSGLAPVVDAEPTLPVPQKVMILTYLDVYGGYVYGVLNDIPVLAGCPNRAIEFLVTQLLNMRGVHPIDIGLPGFVRGMSVRVTQLDLTKHMDTCGIVDPLEIRNLDNMPVSGAYDRRHIDKAQIMLPFKINARRDRRTVSQYGRQLTIDTENRKA